MKWKPRAPHVRKKYCWRIHGGGKIKIGKMLVLKFS